MPKLPVNRLHNAVKKDSVFDFVLMSINAESLFCLKTATKKTPQKSFSLAVFCANLILKCVVCA